MFVFKRSSECVLLFVCTASALKQSWQSDIGYSHGKEQEVSPGSETILLLCLVYSLSFFFS